MRLLVIAATLLAASTPAIAPANPYPTEATADYVMGCMAANGQTPDMLRRCSCSIDAISSVIPYDVYERAGTVLSMLQATGENASLFRETPMLRATVDQLRAAQIEADFRCF